MSGARNGLPDPAGVLRPLGAFVMHAGFVLCTMFARLPAPLEWIFHSTWDFIQVSVGCTVRRAPFGAPFGGE